MAPHRVLVGRVVGAHGVRGWVKLRSFTEVPDSIGSYGPLEDEAGRPMWLSLTGRAKDLFLAQIRGVESREAAEALKGHALYVRRSALPDPGDELYVADLIGLAVRERGGKELGRVAGVQDFGAGPLLEVEPEGGGETVLVPFTEVTVPVVALQDGFIVLDLPAGLWPGPDGEEESEQNGGTT